MAWPNKKRAPEDYFIPLFHPTTQKACPVPQRGWRFPTATMKELLDKGEIIFGDDESVQPQRKYLLKNNLSENIPSILFYGGSDDDLLRKLELEFENPKPVEFTKGLVNAFTSANSNDIVLDFFAGSGTTAHAVIEANNDDRGNRKFVCIQLPEPLDEKSEMFKRGFRSIAELTKNRIKSIVDKCNSESESKLNFENKLSIGLRCFNLSESNFKIWRGDIIENESDLVAQMNIFTKVQKESSKSENILWELMIKGGLSLSEKPLKVLSENGDILYVLQNGQIAYCLDAFNETVQLEILKLKPKISIFLDDLFNRDDCSKTNTQLKFQDNQIEFKTI
ncbi:DNA methyltransferase [Sphingobacterium sp. B29]|uniref:DNA methyltransferase n=1 Tax=Sphingobacterium sp. B29 TaxID=1933220 RepID=UPI0009FA05C8|nr:DNA methyltransferase [Sphingobacterium sp. B29]